MPADAGKSHSLSNSLSRFIPLLRLDATLGGLQRLRPSGSACDGSYRRGWRFYTLPSNCRPLGVGPLAGWLADQARWPCFPVGQGVLPCRPVHNS